MKVTFESCMKKWNDLLSEGFTAEQAFKIILCTMLLANK